MIIIIMIQQFMNRERELSFLERKYEERKPHLLVIYGRRRVGKTEIIKKFIEGRKGVYVLCTRDSLKENISEFKKKFYEATGREYFLKLDTESLGDLFKFLVEELKGGKFIVAVDEFPYLIELEKGITSVLQKAWDETLSKTNIFLILCGSSIGMMETEVLSYKSPLYGRRTGQWKVTPFTVREIRRAFPDKSAEEIVKIWAVFGGTPYYFLQMKKEASVEENIKRKILTKGEVLYNEPLILLREEFREPRIYTLILKYLSLGYVTQGKLQSATGIEKGNLSKYLETLKETGLIEYILPLGKRKRGIYRVSDPFFNFWFRFVYPNLSDLELGLTEQVYLKISRELNAYYGEMFEHLIIEALKQKQIKIKPSYKQVHKWWHKGEEINIVLTNDETHEITFIETKWKKLSMKEALKTISNLERKSTKVNWFKQERKEEYGVIAKEIMNKETIQGKGYIAIDTRDMVSF